jgi:hypothetical protein
MLHVAEGEIGVVEVPIGSNRGPRVEEYQASDYIPGGGYAWCGTFYGWVLQRSGMDVREAQRYASPSTSLMCAIARGENLLCSPRPGAALVWCGTHVEMLHSPMGGPVWRTIGGNTGDGVRWRTRSVAGGLVYAPPGLEDITAEVVAQPLYWLEDTRARAEAVGQWARRAWAEKALTKLDPERRAMASVVARGNGGFSLRIGEPRHYGPWVGAAGKAGRDERARPALEERLGRRLRPYRTERMPHANRVAAEALGKTD